MALRKTTPLKWRNFLNSIEGLDGLLYLRENVPSIGGPDSNSIVFGAGVNQGYVLAIAKIQELAKMDDDKEIGDEKLLNKGLE